MTLSLGKCKYHLKNTVLLVIAATSAAGCLTSGGGGEPTLIDDTPGDHGDASVILSWTPPTQNEDGSALTDLAGYKLYYGTDQGNFDQVISIDNPSVSTYVVENLAPGTYYFVATSFTQTGIESRRSNTAVKVAT